MLTPKGVLKNIIASLAPQLVNQSYVSFLGLRWFLTFCIFSLIRFSFKEITSIYVALLLVSTNLFAKAFLFTPGRTRGFVKPKGNNNKRQILKSICLFLWLPLLGSNQRRLACSKATGLLSRYCFCYCSTNLYVAPSSFFDAGNLKINLHLACVFSIGIGNYTANFNPVDQSV